MKDVVRIAVCMSVFGLLMPGMLPFAHGIDFSCDSGNVGCFLDAIDQTNMNGKENMILLEAGQYNLSAPAARLIITSHFP